MKPSLAFALLLSLIGLACIPPEKSYAETLSFEELLNLEVTSVSKQSEKAFSAPAAVFVLTQNDIQQLGASTIPEALRSIPGLQVARSDASNWSISSRGFNDGFANKLLVLIDGRSVYTPLFSGVYWDIQDTILEDIERIEVIRGPGAALWGANAVNGVINIITKNAADTQSKLITVTSGNEENIILQGRKGVRLGDSFYYRSFLKHSHKDQTTTVNDTMAGDSWHTTRGGFRADWQYSDKEYLTFQGDVYSGKRNLELSLPIVVSPFTEFSDDSLEVQGGNILVRWDKQISDISNIKLQAYYDRADRDYSVFRQEINTFDIDFQHEINTHINNNLIWGAGYRTIFDDLEGSVWLDYRTNERTTNLYSAFIQDKINLVPTKLNLTIGSKFEFNDYTGFEIQPNMRVAWTPNSQQTIWGAISRAVRTPSRSEDDISLIVASLDPGFIRWEGSRASQAEELIAYELGYRTQPTTKMSLDIAAFYNDYDTLRTFEASSPFIDSSTIFDPHLVVPLVVNNNATAETYGIELAAEWEVSSKWRLSGSYTFLQMDVHVDPTSTDTIAELDEGRSPQNQFNIHSNYILPHDLELSNSLYYVDSLSNLSIPSYFRFDSQLRWRPTNTTTISVVGQNLFDDRHQEFSGPLHGIASEIGRNIYAKVSLEF